MGHATSTLWTAQVKLQLQHHKTQLLAVKARNRNTTKSTDWLAARLVGSLAGCLAGWLAIWHVVHNLSCLTLAAPPRQWSDAEGGHLYTKHTQQRSLVGVQQLTLAAHLGGGGGTGRGDIVCVSVCARTE
jgi:hypothetical protein